jgi:hypothetical protein
MSNNASNEGGDIKGDNNASNRGGSIEGDNNASNIGGSIGKKHHHHDDDDDDHDHHRDSVTAPTTDTATYFGETLPTDGVTLAFPVTHNLGTRDTVESVYNPITGLEYTYGVAAGDYTVIHTSDNVTTFVFVTAPAPGAANVVIIGGS